MFYAARQRGERAYEGGSAQPSPDRRAELPAQMLVERELGHRCRGVVPVGNGFGRLLSRRSEGV